MLKNPIFARFCHFRSYSALNNVLNQASEEGCEHCHELHINFGRFSINTPFPMPPSPSLTLHTDVGLMNGLHIATSSSNEHRHQIEVILEYGPNFKSAHPAPLTITLPEGPERHLDAARQNQKNPFSVRKIRVRNSGAGNGCANFMDTWKNAFFLQENLHVHKIPRFGGGGEVPILFLWARGFFWQKLPRDNFCRSLAAQLPSPRGQFWKRRKCPLLWGRGNLGSNLRDNLGEGKWESKNAARQ